jgi:hypothetical protein
MPPRPLLTYAQLCYRAIKAIGGKATLQEITQWITESFDWYKYNDVGWQVRVLIVFALLIIEYLQTPELRSPQFVIESRFQEDGAVS